MAKIRIEVSKPTTGKLAWTTGAPKTFNSVKLTFALPRKK
jgi:hypothetical protein